MEIANNTFLSDTIALFFFALLLNTGSFYKSKVFFAVNFRTILNLASQDSLVEKPREYASSP